MPAPDSITPCRRVNGFAALAALVAVVAGVRPASALTDEEIYRQLRFNRAMPGARAMSMGGAFIGLADDASAAAHNPAGVGYMTRPQVMMEGRLADMDETAFAYHGAFPYNDQNIALGGPDTYGIGSSAFQQEASVGFGYLAYVHPINDYFVIGFSRDERMNMERNLTASLLSGAFPTVEGSAPGLGREALSTSGQLDLLYDSYNLTLASAFIDQFSIGLTIGLARLDVTSHQQNFGYALDDTDGDGQPNTFQQPLDYETVIDDSDTQFTFTAGLLYKPHRKIGIGLTYHDAPTFDLIETIGDKGARATQIRQYFATPLPNGDIVANLAGEFINRMAMPDSYGGGLSFGPFFEPKRGKGGLTIALDATRIEYSDVIDGFVAGLNNQLFGAQSQGVTFGADDATEFHGGLNWSWTVGYNNSIRIGLGGYTDESHTVVSTGRPSAVTSPAGAPIRPGLVDYSEDQTHFTFGAGFTLKRGFHAFSLDAAADFSDLGAEYVGTASYKF